MKELKKERVGFLDIESSGLTASFGFMMCYCIKRENGSVIKRCITPEELRSKTVDKRLVKQLLEDLKQFDRIVTYYGSRFDIPFIRTRAIKWNLEFPHYESLYHTDCYYIIRHRMKLHSNRLQTACDFFDIPSKGHKFNPEVWQRCQWGDPKALKFAIVHNVEDVVSTELLYHKVKEFVKVNKTSICL
jgi:uncharacterized protein YprB with RNaseH-like and TPR domain